MPKPSSAEPVPLAPHVVTWQILSIVLFNFICYLTIGLPIAVLPGWVHDNLGFGTILAGLAVSAQYVATLASRPYAGKICDTKGSKHSVQMGLLACAASGGGLLLAYALDGLPVLSLICLIAGRLLLGVGESLVTTGAMTWGINRVGAAHTGKVISWNGITSYGAIALGAPLGVLLKDTAGFAALGVIIVALALIAYVLTRPRLAPPVLRGERLPFKDVFSRILPFGFILMLGTVGFGVIATFITLYYGSRHWSNPALALSVFGCFFIAARLLFAHSIARFGGFAVALACFVVEVSGLALLWQAGSPSLALVGAALTGFGFALVFPALGVEAVHRVTASNRGAALGAYALFFDLALGITGPLAGLIANHFGYDSAFLFAAVSALLALVLTTSLHLRSNRLAYQT